MTYSICVRERYRDDTGDDQIRFGVAVTTRTPGIGELCPFASEDGAVAVQARCTGKLGPKILSAFADSRAPHDAIPALLDVDDTDPELRQIHALDHEETYTFSGEECLDYCGHRVGENYTVAGNLLAGEGVLAEMERAYRTGRENDATRRLASRLIDALAAGEAAGGDDRDELKIRSAALVVADTGAPLADSYYNDLRADATTDPIADLRERYRLGSKGHEICAKKYGW